MAIFVTGDLHGGFDGEKLLTWDEGERLTRGDYLIVAGDFGYPWDYSEEECFEIAELERGPYTVLFVDGNHERFDHWDDRPREAWRGGQIQRMSDTSPIRRLCRGEVFELGGAKIFCMGGATSVDRATRTPFFDWFPQELPGEDEFEHAREVLNGHNWTVDYVITHACAQNIAPKALWPAYGWQTPQSDRLTMFLNEVEERLTYKKWYFGHFHRDRNIDEKHVLLYNEIVRLGEGL